MLWSATYVEDDWIFMDAVVLRIENTNYDFSDRFSYFDVDTDVFSGGTVYESVFFPFLEEDSEAVEHLLAAGSGTVRLAGSDGIEDISLSKDEVTRIFAALALFQELGGSL